MPIAQGAHMCSNYYDEAVMYVDWLAASASGGQQGWQ